MAKKRREPASAPKVSAEDAGIERRKPASVRKETHLRVRVAEGHMSEFKVAAESLGLTLSAWVVERLLKAARQEAHERAHQTSGALSTTR